MRGVKLYESKNMLRILLELAMKLCFIGLWRSITRSNLKPYSQSSVKCEWCSAQKPPFLTFKKLWPQTLHSLVPTVIFGLHYGKLFLGHSGQRLKGKLWPIAIYSRFNIMSNWWVQTLYSAKYLLRSQMKKMPDNHTWCKQAYVSK